MHKDLLSQWAMCPPDYFGIEYEINPWMQGNIGQTRQAMALQQWQALYHLMITRAAIQLITPVQALPDLVFTANAGLLLENTVILSHFKFAERQKEQPYFLAWFNQQGYQVQTLADNIYFEGEGDALFQPQQPRLWLGYGMRTQQAAAAPLQAILNIEVILLHLINPHFYHLDTCFVPLPGKRALYYPAAFDSASLAKLQAYFPPESRLEVSETDALNFACNAIVIDNIFICNQASIALCQKLHAWGFEVITTPLSEFMRAGGAAKCLVLRLDNHLNNL